MSASRSASWTMVMVGRVHTKICWYEELGGCAGRSANNQMSNIYWLDGTEDLDVSFLELDDTETALICSEHTVQVIFGSICLHALAFLHK